jgi:hypothetical protein
MTLVVEDGTGKADAESYDTTANIAAYLTARGYTVFSSLATESLKEQHARRATDYLDMVYGQRYKGTVFSATQAKLWPRDNVVANGFDLETDVLPTRLLSALAEAAERSAGGTLLPDVTTATGEVVETTNKVGPIEESIRYREGTSVQRPTYPAISLILKPLLRDAGGAIR